MPQLFDLVALIVFTLLLFGITALHFFEGYYVTQVEVPDPRNASATVTEILVPLEHFNSIGAAMVSLFNLMAKVNWPDIGLPAYVEEPSTVAFFLIFVLVTMFLVMSVPVSVVLVQYKKTRKLHILRDRLLERKALTWVIPKNTPTTEIATDTP